MALIVVAVVFLLSLMTGFSTRPLFFEKSRKLGWTDTLMLGLVGFIVLSLLYSGLGLFHQLKLLPFLCLAGAIAAPGAVGLFRHLRTAQITHSVQHAMQPAWSANFLFVLCPVLFIGTYVALLPPLNWDEISYALTFAKLHILGGDIRYLREYGIFSAFPIFGETAIGIPYLLHANTTAVHLLVLSFLFVALMLTYQLYRHFSSSKFFGLLCVVGVAYLPLSLGNIGTAKSEPYQLAYILASACCLLMYQKEKRDGYRYLSYLFIGFAAGIKYTTIFAGPMYLCLYAMTSSGTTPAAAHLKELTRLVAIGIAVNAVWLLNNWIQVCNPLFPNMVGVFGQCLPYPVTKDIMEMVLEGTMLQRNTSWATTHSLANFQTGFVAAYGVLNTVLLLAGVGVFALNRKLWADRNLLGLFIGIVLTVLIQAFAIYWEFRYTYFIFPLMLVFCLAVVERLHGRLLVGAILVCLFGAQAYQAATDYLQRNLAIQFLITGKIKRAEYPDKFIHLRWVATYLNNHTPKDAVIAFNWGVQPFFYLERPFFFMHDWNPEEAIQQMRSPEQLAAVFKKRHLSYLVWRIQDESAYLDPSKSKQFHQRMNQFVAALLQQGVLTEVHAQDDVKIYRITVNQQ